MKLFDLHCDTLYECYETEKNLRKNDLMIDQSKVSEYNQYVQFFALFCGVDATAHRPHSLWHLSSEQRLQALLHYAKQQFTQNEDWLMLCVSAQDLEQAEQQHKAAAFLSIEGAELLATPQHLRQAYDTGVRMVTLSWNYDNLYACGALCDNKKGLTQQGKWLVDELTQRNMIVDVSHLSEQGFWDVCAQTDAPFVASHSNSRAVCNHLRNLTDAQIIELIARGGLCGINLYLPFLREDGRGTLDDAMRHIDHICELGGEHCLALGCDLDGCDQLPDEIQSAADLEQLAEYLLAHHYAQSTVDALFYDNATQFLHRML